MFDCIETLTCHSVKLPKSFVAIDLSEKEAFERRTNGNGNGNGASSGQKKENAESGSESAERGRSEERQALANAGANDIPPVEDLPPSVLNG